MAELFGRHWTRTALLQRVGDISQLGGVRLVTLSEGPGVRVQVAEVRTGSGPGFQRSARARHGHRLRRVPRHTTVLAVVNR